MSQLRYQCFCYNSTFNVIFLYIQVKIKVSMFLENIFLITLEMHCLLVRSNYVRKLDTISLCGRSLILG